jgi:hypothetical protein
LSSNSSASHRWQFRTPHDRRNVPRPRLSRFQSEPRRSSVYGRSRRCRKPVPIPSAPAFSNPEGRHSTSIAWFQTLHSVPSAAKTHSIPRDSSRLRSMNSIRSAPARPFRRSTPFLRRSTSDRIFFIVGLNAVICLRRVRPFTSARGHHTLMWKADPQTQARLSFIMCGLVRSDRTVHRTDQTTHLFV